MRKLRPQGVNASESITKGSVCVENYHAILENVKSSIRDSLKAKGQRVAVLNDEAHHVANESGKAAKRWKKFLLSPDYEFRYVVGVSGTCYVNDEYFADVIHRFSLREAIEQRFVKQVEYVAEMPQTESPEEKWQLICNRHQAWKKSLKKRGIHPLTIVVTRDIKGCKQVQEELEAFLQEWEKIPADQAKARVLAVTSAKEHQANVAYLKQVDRLPVGSLRSTLPRDRSLPGQGNEQMSTLSRIRQRVIDRDYYLSFSCGRRDGGRPALAKGYRERHPQGKDRPAVDPRCSRHALSDRGSG